MQYPFSSQDLQASAIVMRNYMENAGPKVPWLDLRYLIGEIMYGGHIVNDFDRTLCMCYLEYFLRDELLDEMEMFPYRDVDEVGAASFKAPPPTVYEKYLEHIDVVMVGDSPLAFGLHPNAEIDFRTNQCNDMLATIVSLQPNLTDNGNGEHSAQHAADAMLNDIIDAYSEVKFDMSDIRSNMETPGPFQNVFLQECETMNLLVVAMMKTLEELNLGFNQLTVLSPGLGEISTLETLWVDDNKLTTFPPCVLRLTNLKVLRLSNNNIDVVPNEFHKLPSLELVAVDNNNLAEIPSTLYELKHLETLIIRGNRIQTLSKEIGTMKNLKFLQASSNEIEIIPEELGTLTKLATIYLNSNIISKVPAALSGLSGLKKISFANNCIVELPAVLEDMWQLDGSPTKEEDGGGGEDATVSVELHGNPLKRLAEELVEVLEEGSNMEVVEGEESSSNSSKRRRVP